MTAQELDRLFHRWIESENKFVTQKSHQKKDFYTSKVIHDNIYQQQMGINNNHVIIFDPDIQTKPMESPTAVCNAADFIKSEITTPQYMKISHNFRFQEVHYHSHEFVEVNYLYSGECTNTVDGKEYKMSPGDFLIMDTKCRHKLGWTGEDDILINILLLPQFAENVLMEVLTGESILSAFLVSSIYRLSNQPNHIYFNTNRNIILQNAVRSLLCEYYDPGSVGANILMNCYMREIFTLLMRECIEHSANVTAAYEPNSKISQIINYMNANCKTCTRESTARHFGYSPNYLSHIIAKNTGKSFIQIRNEFRLNNIELRLNTTSLSVRELAEEYGFTNTTHFYKLYKEYYGKNPRSPR